MTDTEFREKLLEAKRARLLTIDQMAKMCKTSHLLMERWLNGVSAPFYNKESIIRAVE